MKIHPKNIFLKKYFSEKYFFSNRHEKFSVDKGGIRSLGTVQEHHNLPGTRYKDIRRRCKEMPQSGAIKFLVLCHSGRQILHIGYPIDSLRIP